MSYKNYKVISGDTLSKIAKQNYGIVNEELIQLIVKENSLPDKNKITVGQILRLPNILNNQAQVEKVDNQELQQNFPKFVVGVPNLFNSFNTIKVREIIKDVLNGGKNKYDLQCTEYVCYKIKKEKNIAIDWGTVTSGRDGGKWPAIFISIKRYKVIDYPIAGCAMSFFGSLEKTSAKDTGHIAFVEKVNDDGSIDISEANWPNQGKYNERKKLPKSYWQDKCKARFIDFT